MIHLSEYFFLNCSHFHQGNNCRWCNNFILSGRRIRIPHLNGEYLSIPYCSRKCLLDDPNSTIYIESFKKQSASLKAAYLKQENERKRKNEEVKKLAAPKIDEVKKLAAAKIDDGNLGCHVLFAIALSILLFLWVWHIYF